MVAQRYGVGAGVIDTPRLFAGQPHAGDVFPVDYSEGNMFQLLQGTQMAFQMGKTGLAHHVSHRQNGIQHTEPPMDDCDVLLILSHFFDFDKAHLLQPPESAAKVIRSNLQDMT